MSHVPGVWAFLLLGAASYRVWVLLAEDSILDRPRRWALRLGSWEQDGDIVPADYRARLGEFVGCPWCFGFWIAVAWWGAWLISEWSLVVAVPLALSAFVGVASAVVGYLAGDD